MIIPEFSCLLCALLMLECRSYSYLSGQTLHAVVDMLSFQQLMFSNNKNSVKSYDQLLKKKCSVYSNGDMSISDGENRLIAFGHKNLRMVSCLLLSTGLLSLNPFAALAEAPQPAMTSIQTMSYMPVDRTVDRVYSSLPSRITTKPIPASNIPIMAMKKSAILSLSSLSSSKLQKPEIEIQNAQVADSQTQVNMPSNVREMIAKSASNIPGY